ncbi:MAG: hypothetical protein LQ352_000972 [Teloschistes flavicans]|nr:MAG: hypothetical protein LQ352_000972 [Teloschistes flavicans]
MGSGKESKSNAPKVSATPASVVTSTSTQPASRSAIIRSSFAPSYFQLALFASIIQGFDSQKLRIHDTVTGRLRCEHALAPKATVSSLAWGFYCSRHPKRGPKGLGKKRKRTEEINGTPAVHQLQDVVLALATSNSEIELYSPCAAKLVGILKGVHTQGIRDFKFADAGRDSVGWSIGGDGKLVRWDLQEAKSTKIISLPDQSARVLCPFGSSVLCSSHKTSIIDPEQVKPVGSFTASNSAVHSIKTSSSYNSRTSTPAFFLTAAETDRFINVFDINAGFSVGSLVAETDVTAIAVAPDYPGSHHADTSIIDSEGKDQALAAITRDGVLELFELPFTFSSQLAERESQSLKARMKLRTRKARALVKVVRPDNSAVAVPLLDATFQDDELVLVWAEGGVDLIFDRIRWRKSDSSEITLEGVNELIRAKGAGIIGAIVTNGVKDMGKTQVDESQAVVTTVGRSNDKGLASDEDDVISISSAEEDSDDFEEEENPDQTSQSSSNDAAPKPQPQPQPRIASMPLLVGDVHMIDSDKNRDDAFEERADIEEPSFGEMIRANAPGPVDVQAAFAATNAQAVVPMSERQLQLPSGMSLGTVLTQSLRTNDAKLLETCLHVRQLGIVRATIERLDSSLASTLIQRLAEKFHSRPGRAGSLLVWIQWTVVAHGGYLASQSSAMKTLAALHRVIGERARSLPLLLSLKGKLDMLEAQMNLRASMQARTKAANGSDEDNEEGVIYVEGQEDSNSEDSDADVVVEGVKKDSGSELGSEDEDEEMPMVTNGTFTESDDEGSGSGSGLIDDEAESADQDSDEEGCIDEVDHEDVDPMESDASSEAAERLPSKRPATARLSNGIRTRR